MKPLRMLGLGLAATLAMCAMAVLPAVANAQEETDWAKYKHCPAAFPEIYAEYPGETLFGCTYEQSNATSSFRAGNVEIHLVNPITLQGGLFEPPEEEGAGLTGKLRFVPAVGAPTLAAVAQPGPILDEYVDPSKLTEYEHGLWTAAERTPENARLGFKANEATTVTIELAGNPEEIYLCSFCALFEEGEVLTLPVKVKLSSAFLGENCYVGSNAEPIEIELGTSQSGVEHGAAGELAFEDEFNQISLSNNSLVNGLYASPEAKDCGLRGEADEAINGPLGLPSPSGNNNAIINGTIYIADAPWVSERFAEEEG